MQSLGMGPKFLAYIDKSGRPLWCTLIQIAFGLLAFIAEASSGQTVFSWLLALSGLSYFFVWGSICLAHIRFRRGWAAQGHSLDEIPFRAQFGITGSYLGLGLTILAIIATFYISLFPIGDKPNAEYFFNQYLALPIIIALYVGWKIYSGGKGGLWIKAEDMDLTTGLRSLHLDPLAEKEAMPSLGKRILRIIF